MPNASIATTNRPSAATALAGALLTSTSAMAAIPYITLSDLIPPTLSATAPPSGRTSDPSNTHAAVKSPAVTALRPHLSLKHMGKNGRASGREGGGVTE